MSKRSLLLAGIFAVSAMTRAGRAVGAYEVRGRAAPLSTDEVAGYAVMNCAQMCGECVEVWCDDEETTGSGCTPGTRQVVGVAGQCASSCGSGDLVLSRDVFLGILGTNITWILVNWSCVACDSNSASTGGGDIDSRDIETSCPGNGDSTSSSQVVGEGFSSAQSAANESIGDTVGSSGDPSFNGIAYPGSTNVTSGSSDGDIQEPEADSSSYSGADSVDTSAKSSSNNAINGASDNTGTSDGGGSVWSSSGSASTKPWNEQGEKTAPSMPSLPPTTASASNSGASSSSQTFVPTSTTSSAIVPTATSTLPGPATSTPEPADPRANNTEFPAATLAASVGNSLDGDVFAPVTVNPPSASTTDAPSQTSGGTDSSSGDGSLSATSTVTKSPFFYASIVLAVVGITGVVFGYRAKRMRSHRDEERNYRSSTWAATPASTPSSPTNLGRVQFSDHRIVIL